MSLGDLSNGIKAALLGTIEGAGHVVAATLDATKDNTVKALQGVRDVTREASGMAVDGVAGAVQAASEVGASVGSAQPKVRSSAQSKV